MIPTVPTVIDASLEPRTALLLLQDTYTTRRVGIIYQSGSARQRASTMFCKHEIANHTQDNKCVLVTVTDTFANSGAVDRDTTLKGVDGVDAV